MPTMWSDLCAHGEWHCYEPRHWLCPMSGKPHTFIVVGGSVVVCQTCGKTESWLSSQLNQRLNERSNE